MKKLLLIMFVTLNLFATSDISMVYDDDWKNVDIYPINGAVSVDENDDDWVAIYPEGSSNDWDNKITWAWVRDLYVWHDDQGRGIKAFDFDALPNGNYEVRYFLHNSFDTYSSQSFSVGENSTTSDISMVYDDNWKNIDIYPINGATSVNENYEDWVGIYRQGESSNSDNVQRWAWVRDLYVWHDDQGRGIKAFDFDALPDGNYEVRYFLNNSFDTYRSQSFNIDGNGDDNPFNNKILNTVLQEQNIDESHPHDQNKDESECYSYIDNESIRFEISNNILRRCELRASKNNEWSLKSHNGRELKGTVKLSINDNGTKEITWMQLHHVGGKPFVRLALRNNELIAIVRKNENKGKNNTDNYHFGSFDDIENTFFDTKIKVINENTLEISINGITKEIEVPSHWKDIDNFYFKAGLYFSGKKNSYRSAVVEYSTLKIEE